MEGHCFSLYVDMEGHCFSLYVDMEGHCVGLFNIAGRYFFLDNSFNVLREEK